MAYLAHADKLTHYVVGSLLALALLPLGFLLAASGVCLAAAGREVYGQHKRGRRMNRADWVEAAQDFAFTLGGGAVVLLAAFVGA